MHKPFTAGDLCAFTRRWVHTQTASALKKYKLLRTQCEFSLGCVGYERGDHLRFAAATSCGYVVYPSLPHDLITCKGLQAMTSQCIKYKQGDGTLPIMGTYPRWAGMRRRRMT